MVTEQFIEVSGHRLRVALALERPGTPLLIFNGIGASVDLLKPLIEQLDAPVVTFDLPGVGASMPAVIPRRMSELARLASRLLDELQIDCCHVMGISWGGALAQEFARKFPNRVERLVLAATSSGHLMVPPSLSVMLKMATPLRYLSAGYFRSIAGQIYGGDFRHDPDRAERHARLMTSPSIWGYLSQIYAMTGWTSLFWLHRITAPTLVLAGEDDPIIPLVNARILTARLRNARLITYDCGHLFVLTRLEAVSAEIDSFLLDSDSDYRQDAHVSKMRS